MDSPYNLRCKKKNNKSETISYLKKVLKNKPIHEYNPEVRLERLKLLEIDKGSCVSYSIPKEKILSKKVKNKKKYSGFKYLSAIGFWSILVIIGIYLAGNFEKSYQALLKGLRFRTTLGDPKSIDNWKDQKNECFEKEIKNIIRNNLKEFGKESTVNEWLAGSPSKKDNLEEFWKFDDLSANDIKDTDQFLAKMLMTDYALESKGAKIVSILDTKPYGVFIIKFGKYEFKVTNFFFQKLFRSKGPTSVLVPWTKPGDCWAFEGSYGKIIIELSEKIFVTAVSIDHVRSDFLPYNSVKSAPKNFSVTGFSKFSGQSSTIGIYLGSYTYNIDGPITQTFIIPSKVEKALKAVQITFESNHGNQEYTCVYKIRVHGHA